MAPTHSPCPSIATQIRSALRTVWGYSDFRPSQRQVISAALQNRDVLALLPTGGGKSICFQAPALVADGVTVVVSPLISLMQDQVAALERRGVAAAMLSSSQAKNEQYSVWERLAAGQLKLLYLSPERLERLVARRDRIRLARLAVDEAHCISEWGHEFRPHYRDIGRHRQALGNPPTIAVTATATPETRDDIVRVLGLRQPARVTMSFDRPNLHFAVRRCRDVADRLRKGIALIREVRAGSVVVYVPTRNQTDGVTALLRRRRVLAEPYHGALPADERQRILEAFVDGRVRVIVATNAFGMGIDKPDVRRVIHLGLPTRPEAYYQEAGRAGRDGEPGECILLWLREDLSLARSIAGVEGPARLHRAPARRRAVERALRAMRRYVKTWRCRRAVLLEYLGEVGVTCAGCDRCGPSGFLNRLVTRGERD